MARVSSEMYNAFIAKELTPGVVSALIRAEVRANNRSDDLINYSRNTI